MKLVGATRSEVGKRGRRSVEEGRSGMIKESVEGGKEGIEVLSVHRPIGKRHVVARNRRRENVVKGGVEDEV